MVKGLIIAMEIERARLASKKTRIVSPFGP